MTTARSIFRAASRRQGISRSISAVLPAPTGPPIPNPCRPGSHRTYYLRLYLCTKGNSRAGSHISSSAIDTHLESSAESTPDLSAGVIVHHVALVEACAPRRRHQADFFNSEIGRHIAFDGEAGHEA